MGSWQQTDPSVTVLLLDMFTDRGKEERYIGTQIAAVWPRDDNGSRNRKRDDMYETPAVPNNAYYLYREYIVARKPLHFAKK